MPRDYAMASFGLPSQGDREFDVVLLGGTGTTGMRTVKALAAAKAREPHLSYAVAGRSIDRLRAVVGDPAVALIAADTSDPASLDALCARTKVGEKKKKKREEEERRGREKRKGALACVQHHMSSQMLVIPLTPPSLFPSSLGAASPPPLPSLLPPPSLRRR